MSSFCARRFIHMSTDIEKLRSSTILVMLPELPMSFVLKLFKDRLSHCMVRSFRRPSV